MLLLVGSLVSYVTRVRWFMCHSFKITFENICILCLVVRIFAYCVMVAFAKTVRSLLHLKMHQKCCRIKLNCNQLHCATGGNGQYRDKEERFSTMERANIDICLNSIYPLYVSSYVMS